MQSSSSRLFSSEKKGNDLFRVDTKKTITFVVYKKEIQMLPDELKGMIAVLAVRDRWAQDIIFQKETAKAGGRQTGQNQDRNH